MVIGFTLIITFLLLSGVGSRKEDDFSYMLSPAEKGQPDTLVEQVPVQRTGSGSRISKILKIVLSVLLVTTLLGCNAFFTNFRKTPNPRLDRPLSHRPGKDIQDKYKIDKKTGTSDRRKLKKTPAVKCKKRPSGITWPRIKPRKPAKIIRIKKPNFLILY